MKKPKFEIDWTAADNITRLNLKEVLAMNKKQMKDKKSHPDDRVFAATVVAACEVLLTYFGDLE